MSAGAPANADMLIDEPPKAVEFRLAKPRAFESVDLMLPILDTASDRMGPFRMYATGPWGRWIREGSRSLSWRPGSSAPEELSASIDRDATGGLYQAGPFFEFATSWRESALGLVRDRTWMGRFKSATVPTFDTTGSSLASDGFESIFRLPPQKPVVDWRCRRRPVLIMRAGGETDRFDLVHCDGSVAPEALDRLSILARPPDVPRPGDLLPDEPSATAWAQHEWTEGVRVVHPRLVWALQQVADAFPNKAIFLYSGYRPRAEVNDASRHRSLHADGRALDIGVSKVRGDDLFRVCTKLRGIGCGYYPHNKFVHFDVRKAGAGEAFFVDTSTPGEPAQYATDYPGLLEDGKLVGGR